MSNPAKIVIKIVCDKSEKFLIKLTVSGKRVMNTVRGRQIMYTIFELLISSFEKNHLSADFNFELELSWGLKLFITPLNFSSKIIHPLHEN